MNSNCQPAAIGLAVRVVLVLLATAGIAGAVSVIALVPPTETSFYPRCWFHSLTGLHCPGCGTTRALHALLNGRITQAVAYNALAFVLLPVIGWSLFRSLQTWYTLRPPPRASFVSRLLMYLLLVAITAFWVLRNLPGLPFTLLAPHDLPPD